jgi:hypothetical protein
MKGWVIIDESTATGGIFCVRQEVQEHRKGRGIQTSHLSTRHVDHVEICAALDAVPKKADYILRKHCARWSGGWFTDDHGLARIREEIEILRQEAEDLNDRASRVDSERRAHVGIVAARPAEPEFSASALRTVRGALTDMLVTLREERKKDVHKLKIRTTNLHLLARGTHAAALRYALRAFHRAYGQVDIDALQAVLKMFEGSSMRIRQAR